MVKGKALSQTDKIVAEAQKARIKREQDYREKALKQYAWICGRCSREFNRQNIQELTVHHRDHDHDNNPEDGSNWELLCVYCHDNEHQRLLEADLAGGLAIKEDQAATGTHNPFADLRQMMEKKK